MKIVVLDGYTLNPGDLSWEGLQKFGDLTVYDRTAFDRSGESLIIERVGDANIVFTNKTPLSREALSKMPNVKYIGVLATGYNVVDIEAAKELGITVTNIPTYGTDSVGQMAIALLLEMCHHVWEHSEAVKNGEWTSNPDWCFWKYPLIELAGKTAGIIGYGRIGQVTGRIAQALGMKVLANDLYQNKELESSTMKYVELDELLSKADVIFLHCPLFDSTEGIINKDNIAKMKDGVVIVNCDRGGVIKESDLLDALNSGKVKYAGLDVFEIEPAAEAQAALVNHPRVSVTPHIGAQTEEAQDRVGIEIAEKIVATLKK